MKTIIAKKRIQVMSLATTDYDIRVEEVRGSSYWVVPVVMMVEGVHHGSRGPLLYTEEELAASVAAWNGMPVTIGHPQDEEGTYISANLPSVLEGVVGRIYNAKMRGNKLTAEAWIDVNTLEQTSEEAAEYIKEKKALDVSIGVFSEEQRGAGEFNGEAYRAAAINLRPDHLALLPGVDGACSWADGCGIRNNIKNDMKTNKNQKEDKAAWLAALLERGIGSQLTANDVSLNERLSKIHELVNSLDNDVRVYYLEEVYNDYVIYCTVNRETRERNMYKRNYAVSNDGKVTFQGDPVEVRKEVSFINMAKHTKINSNTKIKQTMKRSSKPCTCTVDSLIGNEATRFTEDDREWLSDLSQEQLNKLAPQEEEKPKPVANKATETPKKSEDTDGGSLISKGEDGSISINGKTIDQYIKESLAKDTDPMKFIDNFMPDGLKEQMKSGLKMYQERRAKMTKEIAANSKFKEEQLKSWSDEDLSVLHASLIEEDAARGGNYAAMGAGEDDDDDASDVGADVISAMLSFAKPAVKPSAKEEAKK